MIRRPQAAGQFYPATQAALKNQIEQLLEKLEKKEDALGAVLPHAGYIFSGKVAAACLDRLNLTKTVIILGPNHTGCGAPFSIMTQITKWQTPLGITEIDEPLAKGILNKSDYLEDDLEAHKYEHSIEVQLPFLQYLSPEVRIVPIVIADADFEVYNEIGKAIVKALIERKQRSLIVASSDMTHYESQNKAQANDKLAIDAILKLDGQELLKRVKRLKITMCGYGPTVIMVSATKELGATSAQLVKYQTSGDVNGDYSHVVGYAGIVVQ